MIQPSIVVPHGVIEADDTVEIYRFYSGGADKLLVKTFMCSSGVVSVTSDGVNNSRTH